MQKRAEVTREKILMAATTLFSEKGLTISENCGILYIQGKERKESPRKKIKKVLKKG